MSVSRAACAAAIATICIAAATLAARQSTPDQSVASIVERELKAARIPGATFAIVSGNDITVAAYGLADAERGLPMTPETRLQVGSLNKLITALALGATLDAQKIDHRSPIEKHVAGLKAPLGTVTFHQLLSQTSGLRDHAGGTGTTDETALAARVRGIGERDFVLPPGTVFSYSNLGYAAAGFALEQLRRRPFADALRAAVFEPLNMRATTMRPAELEGHARAVGHTSTQTTPATITTADNDTSLWPAGYLWTTAGDMAQVLSRLLKRTATATLPSPIFSRVAAPHAPMPNVFVGGHYGYGLMLAADRGVRIYEHGGTQRGFSAILRAAPERGFGLVLLTNLDNAPLRRLAQTVMAEALQLPKDTPPARKETPVAVGEMTKWSGVYRNRGTAEIAVRENAVFLILDGGPALAVTRIGEHRYLARPKPDIAGPEFVLQPATATTPAYLHFALWAYTR